MTGFSLEGMSSSQNKKMLSSLSLNCKTISCSQDCRFIGGRFWEVGEDSGEDFGEYLKAMFSEQAAFMRELVCRTGASGQQNEAEGSPGRQRTTAINTSSQVEKEKNVVCLPKTPLILPWAQRGQFWGHRSRWTTRQRQDARGTRRASF